MRGRVIPLCTRHAAPSAYFPILASKQELDWSERDLMEYSDAAYPPMGGSFVQADDLNEDDKSSWSKIKEVTDTASKSRQPDVSPIYTYAHILTCNSCVHTGLDFRCCT